MDYNREEDGRRDDDREMYLFRIPPSERPAWRIDRELYWNVLGTPCGGPLPVCPDSALLLIRPSPTIWQEQTCELKRVRTGPLIFQPIPRRGVMSAVVKVKTAKELAREAMDILAKKNDGTTIKVDDLIEAVRSKSSPLHQYFTWNCSEAARRWWVQEANKLIPAVYPKATVEQYELRWLLFDA
jgi:hypothetical protein